MLILGLVLLFNIKAGIETLRWLVVFALIFAAVEAQLGLTLEPAKAPREFIVIDRVERPSPN